MAFRKLFFKRVQGIRDTYLLQEGDIALDESDFKLYRGDGSTIGGIAITGAGGGSGIALTDISVTQNSASGAGTLAYNSSTGVITYTPPTASGLGAKTSVSQADVTQHQAALSITESQISDFGTYLTSVSEADVTQHQAALSITESQISDLGSYITGYTVTESDVTTHQAALSITESQISDLGSYITASSTTTFTNKSFDADGTGNTITNIDLANLKSDVLDTDLSSVSGADDTIASAKAIKAYVDANSGSSTEIAQGNSYASISDSGSNGEFAVFIDGNFEMRVTDSGMKLGATYPVTVDRILDEDSMASDSDKALATQQSIKAYVDANVGGGGSSLQSRTTKAGTTGSLADAAQENLDITGFKGYALLKVQTDRAARVRIYTDAASRTADAARAEGTDPAADDGVIAEVITTAAETVLISPGAFGFNNESTPTTTIPCRVTNKSGSSSTVTVTLHVLQLES